MSRAPVALTGSGVLGVAGVLLLAYVYVKARGAAGEVADAAARAVDAAVSQAGEAARQVVTVADGAAVAVVGAAGQVVGLPTPAQTVDDPAAVRWIADNFGLFEASKWATAGALFKHFSIPTGAGVPPPPGSAAGQALGVTAADVARAINRGG